MHGRHFVRGPNSVTRIDPRAVVDRRATLADDVEVGPYAIIGPDVEIDRGTRIGPHAVIKGPTRLGQHNVIFQLLVLVRTAKTRSIAANRPVSKLAITMSSEKA